MKYILKPLLAVLGLGLSSVTYADVSRAQQENLLRYVENEIERRAFASEYDDLLLLLESPELSTEEELEIQEELKLYILKAEQLRREAKDIAVKQARLDGNAPVGVLQLGCEDEAVQFIFGTESDLHKLSNAAAVFQAKQKLDMMLSSVSSSSDFNPEEFSRWISLIGQPDSPLINSKGEFQLDQLPVVKYRPAAASNAGNPGFEGAAAGSPSSLEVEDTLPFVVSECYGISYIWPGGDCTIGTLTVCDNIFSAPKCVSCVGLCIEIFGADKTCKTGCSWLGFPGCACRE